MGDRIHRSHVHALGLCGGDTLRFTVLRVPLTFLGTGCLLCTDSLCFRTILLRPQCVRSLLTLTENPLCGGTESTGFLFSGGTEGYVGCSTGRIAGFRFRYKPISIGPVLAGAARCASHFHLRLLTHERVSNETSVRVRVALRATDSHGQIFTSGSTLPVLGTGTHPQTGGRTTIATACGSYPHAADTAPDTPDSTRTCNSSPQPHETRRSPHPAPGLRTRADTSTASG